MRNDRVCAQLHFNIFKEIMVKLESEHWYERVPKSVKSRHEGKVIILRNEQVRSNRTIPNNKLDIIIRENKKKNMHVNRCCNSWREKCDQERS